MGRQSVRPYLSPEEILGEEVTPRTDVYGLGLVLFELLTGRHPFPGPAERLPARHLHEPVPSVRELRPDLPDGIEEVVGRATAKDPGARFPDAPALAAALHRVLRTALAGPAAERVAEPRNPYKGLRPFQEADAADFFGRAQATQQLLARMAEPGQQARSWRWWGRRGAASPHWSAAGLLPALRRGALPGSAGWFVVELLPGAHPFEELEAALLRIAVNPPSSLLQQLQRDEHGLRWAAERVLPAGDAELLLVVDQFEELFTLLAFDRDPLTRGPTVEVAHEALLREWGRLRGWIESAPGGPADAHRLAAATEWTGAGRDPSFLLGGGRLQQFQAWAATSSLTLTGPERRYLEASAAQHDAERAERQARAARQAALERRAVSRLRALVAVLAALALVASGLTVVAFNRQAAARRQARIALARELAAAAVADVAFSPDGTRLAVATSDGTTRIWDLASQRSRERLLLATHGQGRWDLAFSPDGRRLAAAGLDRPPVVLDATTGCQIRTLPGRPAADLAVSPDGRRLAATILSRGSPDLPLRKVRPAGRLQSGMSRPASR
jgi:Novel STAND NTPase 1/WD domain, G-beta repeat